MSDAERTSVSAALRDAAALLERVASDRSLLAALSMEERKRLIQAAGAVYHPDPASRRRLVKAFARLKMND